MGNCPNYCRDPYSRFITPQGQIPALSAHGDQQLEKYFNQHPNIKNIIALRKRYLPDINLSNIHKLENGVYFGAMEKGQKHGKGIMVYTVGFVYEGTWSENLRDGCGRLIDSSGDVYEGSWSKDYPHGDGTYDGVNPLRRYSGKWREGKMHGYGKEKYADGSYYCGNFENGLKDGYGKLTIVNEGFYEGEFSKNLINGEGIWNSLSFCFEGNWKNGVMDGKGKSTWIDENRNINQCFNGQYANGLRHGRGLRRLANHQKWEEEWENGQLIHRE